MKNLYNKYFEFIGIDNEGYRRISKLIIILLSAVSFPLWIEFIYYLLEYNFEIYFTDYLILFFIIITIGTFFLIVLSSIVYGILAKTFTWILDGFKENE